MGFGLILIGLFLGQCMSVFALGTYFGGDIIGGILLIIAAVKLSRIAPLGKSFLKMSIVSETAAVLFGALYLLIQFKILPDYLVYFSAVKQIILLILYITLFRLITYFAVITDNSKLYNKSKNSLVFLLMYNFVYTVISVVPVFRDFISGDKISTIILYFVGVVTHLYMLFTVYYCYTHLYIEKQDNTEPES